MKKFFLGVFAIAGLVACVQTEEVDIPNLADNQIAFGGYVGNSVRTAVDPSTTVGGLNHFTVWAYVGDSQGEVFNSTLVSKDGNNAWTYDDARYWMDGHDYRFFAITPYGNGVGNVEVVNNPMKAEHDPFNNGLGQINFTNENGTEDVLYASSNESTKISVPEKVTFNFNHILSKIKFTFTNDHDGGVQLVIKDIKMTVPKNGHVALNEANLIGTPAADRVKYSWELDGTETLDLEFGAVEGGAKLNDGETAEADKELFTIPALDTQEYKISFTVEVWDGNACTPKTLESTLSGKEFVSGTAYNLTATITPETLDAKKIEFDAIIVDWVQDGDTNLYQYESEGFGYDVINEKYNVENVAGIEYLAQQVNGGRSFEGETVVLNGDIDLAVTRATANFTPIGTEQNPFCGIFDGNGCTIKNLNYVSDNSDSYVGFFGYAKNATIKNVTFENVNVEIKGADGGYHIGAVVGVLATNDPDSAIATKSYIENVTVKGNIYINSNVDATGSSRVAVVLGGNNNSDVILKNVNVIANEGSYVKANSYAGGIVGQTNRKAYFENCTSNIDVTATRFFAGGIAGAPGNEVAFVNCHSTGDVAVTAGRSGTANDHYRVGGIAGGWDDNVYFPLVLTNCSYTGKLSGTNADGRVAEKFDYMGYVGRGYSVKNGSTVTIDILSFVQTAPGIYDVIVAEGGENVVVNDAKEFIAAVNKVEDGGVITIGADFDFTTEEGGRSFNSGTWYDGLYYVGDKSFTIDLNNHTIGDANGAVNDYLFNFKNDGTKANVITIKNGTLNAGTKAFCAICSSASQAQPITLNLEGVKLYNKISNGSTIKWRGGCVLNVKAGTKITGEDSYLGIECVASTVNIYDGAEIYMNGTSSYCGCLVGACGNGVVNVYGGYGQGAKGGFIAMTSGGTINVAGGEWIANTDGTIGNNSNVYVLTAQNNKQESSWCAPSIINVTGGTLRGGMDAWVLTDPKVEKAELHISGGNYNTNPTNYLVNGATATENNGIWTVVKK